MSLRIIRTGVLDTIQDLGRFGFQYQGINPGGAMDHFAAQTANMLVGNSVTEAVIEMHYPASIFLFQEETMIALAGADFSAAINGEDIPIGQPAIVTKNSILQFRGWKEGSRCYLGIKEKLAVSKWLNSYSTNLKAACGGFSGRSLQKDDVIPFTEQHDYTNFLNRREFVVLPWKVDVMWNEAPGERIFVVPGNEHDQLTEESKRKFSSEPFVIGSLADRMGYRIQTCLEAQHHDELVSSPVSFGTIQLFPNGELIILMADHQTTGGYPRIGHVATAHLPMLAQKRPGDKIYFQIVDSDQAETLFFKQQQHLLQLQNACKFRLEEFFNALN